MLNTIVDQLGGYEELVGRTSTGLSEVRPGRVSRPSPEDDVLIDLLDNTVDVNIDKSLEFTITMNPKLTDRFTDEEVRDRLRNFLNHVIPLTVKYILFPEYGHNYHLHYHGILYGANHESAKKRTISRILKLLRKNVGFTHINQIENTEKYTKYIKKERPEMEDIEDLIIYRI